MFWLIMQECHIELMTMISSGNSGDVEVHVIALQPLQLVTRVNAEK
jgi:hypothetical protein